MVTALRVHTSIRPCAWSRVAIQPGHAVPGQDGAAGQQGGLVGLDDKQVVGLLAGHQKLGGTGMVWRASAATTTP
jgi:hypothetical protein